MVTGGGETYVYICAEVVKETGAGILKACSIHPAWRGNETLQSVSGNRMAYSNSWPFSFFFTMSLKIDHHGNAMHPTR